MTGIGKRPPSRREVLEWGGGLAAAAWLRGATKAGLGSPLARNLESLGLRQAGSLPDPTRPMGTADPALPFDHIVIVMMENHSFDNYLGMLPMRGVPDADGFRFDAAGAPLDANPGPNGPVRAFRSPVPCQPYAVTQSWNATHRQINGGAMDGFVATSGDGAMAYWDDGDLPFVYALARNFTVANRWFCSAPCQTYPNRRFLLAGTARGLISTDTTSIFDAPPPHGTIVDRLADAGLTFKNYFTDLPSTGIIRSIILRHPTVLAPLAQFYADCAAGTLPAVSLVDPDFNLTDIAVGAVQGLPGVSDVEAALGPDIAALLRWIRAQGASEENPTNIRYGESFVAAVVNAVLHSPAWARTLLVWTHDEHGGYYDHVPPPAAIPPDDVPPRLGPGDAPGGYDIYGPRVPAIVVSPYARRGSVSNIVHDHTSVLATIEAKWNLPALTRRDANAATLADFLDLTQRPHLVPPVLPAPADSIAGSESCDGSPIPRTPAADPVTAPVSQLLGQLGF